jgi:hypothetical protein
MVGQSLSGHLITRVSYHQACTRGFFTNTQLIVSLDAASAPVVQTSSRHFKKRDVQSVHREEAGIGCWQKAVKKLQLTYSWHLTVAQHVRGPWQRSAVAACVWQKSDDPLELEGGQRLGVLVLRFAASGPVAEGARGP